MMIFFFFLPLPGPGAVCRSVRCGTDVCLSGSRPGQSRSAAGSVASHQSRRRTCLWQWHWAGKCL